MPDKDMTVENLNNPSPTESAARPQAEPFNTANEIIRQSTKEVGEPLSDIDAQIYRERIRAHLTSLGMPLPGVLRDERDDGERLSSFDFYQYRNGLQQLGVDEKSAKDKENKARKAYYTTEDPGVKERIFRSIGGVFKAISINREPIHELQTEPIPVEVNS